jgi:hypothetical protein
MVQVYFQVFGSDGWGVKRTVQPLSLAWGLGVWGLGLCLALWMPLADDHPSVTLRGRKRKDQRIGLALGVGVGKKKKNPRFAARGGEHGTREYRSWIMDHGSWILELRDRHFCMCTAHTNMTIHVTDVGSLG